MARFLLALSALLLPSMASADWIQVAVSRDEAVYFMDPARIKLAGSRRQAWVKTDHSNDRSVSFRESMSLISFDCEKQTYKLLVHSTRDSYGKLISSNTYPDSSYGAGYQPIIPETVLERLGELACYKPESD